MKEQKKSLLERVTNWSNKRLDLMTITEWFLAFAGLLYGELDRRLELREALQKNLKKPVPNHVNWTFCFGGMTFFVFIVQVITGILLTLYYRPSPTEAYESVRHITNDVNLGWLIRGIHNWGTHVMLILLFLHTMRVLFMGAYKPPRELNWIVGVGLLLVTMGFGFTGYLLPWDQVAYWATTVGSEVAGAVPLVGKYIILMMRGGTDVTGETLTRFYSGHVIILPLCIVVLLGLHFLMIRRQGVAGPL